jgi:hypothetical protein
MQTALVGGVTVQVPLKCALCRIAVADCASLGTVATMTGCNGRRVSWCPKFKCMPEAEKGLIEGSFRVVKADIGRRNMV